MSKDLEKEYKALVNDGVPDLWARIEEKLDDKKVIDEKVVDMENNKIKNKKIFNFNVWTTVAAACLCVVLVIPIMTIHLRGGEKNTAPRQDSSSLNGEAYAPKAADAGMAEAYDNTMDDAPMDNAVMDDAVGNGGDEGAALAADVTADGAVNAAAGGVDMEAENAAEASETSDIFEAEVQILGVYLHMDINIVYTAKILNSDNPELDEDSEIEIIAYYYTDDFKQLEKNAAYTLKLQPYSLGEEHDDGKQSYIIVEYE